MILVVSGKDLNMMEARTGVEPNYTDLQSREALESLIL